MAEPAREAEAVPCAECGAALSYDPGAMRLVCPYCGTENEISDDDDGAGPWERTDAVLVERDLAATLDALARAEAGEGAALETARAVRCPSCGAEVGFDRGADGAETDTLAADCPFCAHPLSREAAHDHRHPRPQGVLPFAIDERRAREAMRGWIASRWFAPSDLGKFASAARPIRGVYVPHYTFDADATADYTGKRGDHYYVTRPVMRNGKTEMRRVRRTRWRRAAGRVRRAFDDVLVPATATLGDAGDEATVAGAAEWDLDAMAGYDARWLAGFRAEAPALPLAAGFERASAAMDDALREDVRRDIGGDRQVIASLRADYRAVTFKHVLLPVWLAAYRYDNRPYRVVVNGRTGRVSGERPWSWWKIGAAVAAALALGAVAWWLAASGQLGAPD